MPKKKVADLLVEVLAEAGVRQIYGVCGDSLNGVTDSISGQKQIQWIHVRHEETAAFAAGGEAHLTRRLAVCAGSCGPGNLHLINGLYDCHRSRVPVLAIAAQIPTSEIGSGYFQETHPEQLFAQCSHYCELVSHPEQMPRVLEIAMQTGISRRGVAVVVLPGDVALLDAVGRGPRLHFPEPKPSVCPSEDELALLAKVLNDSKRTTILAGAGCAGAHQELIELAGKLKAPIVHAMRGKEFIEYDNPFDVGMTGLLGFSSGYHAMMSCDVLLMIGNDFDAHLKDSLEHYRKARKGLDELATEGRGSKPIHPQYLARLLDELAAKDAIFSCDVGTPTIWAARYLRMNGQRRLLGSFT